MISSWRQRSKNYNLVKKILLLFTTFLFFFIFLNPVFAAEDWVIEKFNSKISILNNGKVYVTETIDVDFGQLEKHGIYRDIPIVYYTDGAPVYTELSISSVSSSGSTITYQTRRKGDFMEIKIGDPNRLISGRVQYQISYLVEGALKSFPDHDELYWDITGNNWPVTIHKASAEVTLTNGNILKITCFEGVFGSKENCSSLIKDPANAYFETTKPLQPGEDFTIVAGFPKDTFPILTVDPPKSAINYSYSSSKELNKKFNLWIFIPLISIGLFFILKLWQGSRNENLPNETIMVEYYPPVKLKPAEMGTLIDERADTLDVTATIIHLASRGFLTIEEKEKKWIFGSTDYIFKKIELGENGLQEYEKLLFDKLFDNRNSVNLSELKLNFYKDLVLVKKEIYKDILKKKFFLSNPEQTRNIYLGFGLSLLVCGIILFLIGIFDPSGSFVAIGASLFLLGFVLIIISSSMPKRTFLGRSTYIKCLGYKLFLEKVETYKQRFMENENLFNEVLPYTIIFGITEKFAQAFKDLGIKASEPAWYISSKPFSLYHFGASMHSFSNSVNSAIAQAPSRGNFASGGSGFGGGGFSGGGGGGGGGGGW